MSAIGPIPNVAANGAGIPLVGLGTWELRGRPCSRVVEQALRLGYRHIDTAEMYDNERDVGEGQPADAAFRRGADLRRLHQRVPEPLSVDCEVLHVTFPRSS